MWRGLQLLMVLCACGRIDFAELAPDATPDAFDECAIERLDLGPWQTPTVMTPLNSGNSDDDPAPRDDGLELIFGSNRPAALGQADFFRVRRAARTDVWGPVEHMLDLSTVDNENTPELSSDGLTIWFASDRPGSSGNEDIWTATRPDLDSAFGTPVVVSELSSPQMDRGPSVFDHDLAIVFFSPRAGGPGANDIFISRRASPSDPWSTPTPLTPPNTAGEDQRPFMSPCGLQLYFQSPTRGPDNDFYVTRRTSTADSFVDTGTLIPELSAVGLDQDIHLTPDLRHAYFSSARGTGLDLWESSR